MRKRVRRRCSLWRFTWRSFVAGIAVFELYIDLWTHPVRIRIRAFHRLVDAPCRVPGDATEKLNLFIGGAPTSCIIFVTELACLPSSLACFLCHRNSGTLNIGILFFGAVEDLQDNDIVFLMRSSRRKPTTKQQSIMPRVARVRAVFCFVVSATGTFLRENPALFLAVETFPQVTDAIEPVPVPVPVMSMGHRAN